MSGKLPKSVWLALIAYPRSKNQRSLSVNGTIIVEMEKRHPKRQTFHKYLHYVQPVDKYKQNLTSEWQGVTNRVQQMLSAQSNAQSEELQNAIQAQDDKIAAVHKEIQNLSAQVG